MKYKTLCFDLDGTLVDSKFQIKKALLAALKDFSVALPTEQEIDRKIGFGAFDVFREFLKTDDSAYISKVIERYRSYYDKFCEGTEPPYEGIEGLLSKLSNLAASLRPRMFVVTMKSQGSAKKIVSSLGWDAVFQDVIGIKDPQNGQLDVSEELKKKDSLLRELYLKHDIEPASAVMIGDRSSDITAGKIVGSATIGVSYGFGSEEELWEAGADAVAKSVLDLEALFE